MLRGRTSTQATFYFVLILDSKQQAYCANREQEQSEATADAPSIERCGIDRTEGHSVEVVELVSSGLCSCELQ
jgi:hypothetical protein